MRERDILCAWPLDEPGLGFLGRETGGGSGAEERGGGVMG